MVRHLSIIFLFSCATLAAAQTKSTTRPLPDSEDPDDLPFGQAFDEPEPKSSPEDATPRAAETDAKDKGLSLEALPMALGTFLPYKYGVAATYRMDPDHRIGFEYLTGSAGIDVAGIDLSLLRESYWLIPIHWGSESFYWKTSAGWRVFSLGFPGFEDALAIEGALASFGIGNRWQIGESFVIAADWLEVYIPVGGQRIKGSIAEVEEEIAETGVDRAVDVLKRLPTLSFLKLRLGYAW